LDNKYDENEPPKQMPKTTTPEKEVRDTVSRIIAEASMSAIEAESSDVRVVNLLRSFRAQADVLGTLGVFDSPNTVIGKVLHNETGGHKQLLKTIDAHIARERAKEPPVDMGAYMKSPKLPDSLPYHVFDDNEELKDLAIRRIGVELDSINAISRVLDASLESEMVIEHLNAARKVQTTKILKAERSLRHGIVRATNALLVDNPVKNHTGRWSLVVNDPEYARLAEEHKKQLMRRDKRVPAPAASTMQDVLPPTEQVTSSVWSWMRTFNSDQDPEEEEVARTAAEAYERRQAELKRLKGRFTQQQVNLLVTNEFVENVGGVVDYVLAFAKYSVLEHWNNPLQATLTAIPIALGIMAATGSAWITLPWTVGSLVLTNTVKGVLNRIKHKNPISPPALRKLFKFVKESGDLAIWTSIAGTLGCAGIVPGLVHEAFKEYELLGLLYIAQNAGNGIWGTGWLAPPPTTPADVARIASNVREAVQTATLQLGTASQIVSADTVLLNYNAGTGTPTRITATTEGWTRHFGSDWIRYMVDKVWSGALNSAGPLLIAGSTVWKIVSFEVDSFRPDRARLYLYTHDPANPQIKNMMEQQAWALPALSILYEDVREGVNEDDKNRRGAQIVPRTIIDNPQPVKKWLPVKSNEALKNAKDWKNWYDGQTDWYNKPTSTIIRNAKKIATWSTSIRDMNMDLTDQEQFNIVSIMQTHMKALKADWEEWKKMWTAMEEHSGRSGGDTWRVDWFLTTPNVDSENISKSWYMLFKVLEYQYKYVTGGRNPAYRNGVYFDTWAHNLNTPMLTRILEEMHDVFPKAKQQSALPNGGRTQFILANFRGTDSDKLQRLFEQYYPAARNITPPMPPNTLEEWDEKVAQGDDIGLGPLQAVPMGGVGVQASVVDEVYARVSALRLWG
jgi:hypothetical protein